MYRIGEFSYMCKTTLKTLRYYDQKGLLIPERIDSLTGYRYYSDEQLKRFNNIKKLQESGFSLEEIREILDNNNNIILREREEFIEKQYKKQIKVLQEMKTDMNKKIFYKIGNVKFEGYSICYVIGEKRVIKNRNEIIKILKKIDKKLEPIFSSYNKDEYVFYNYEVGYKEQDISCFIGRIVIKQIINNYNILKKLEKAKLSIMYDDKLNTCLHTTVTGEMMDSYQDIVSFANKNNIQIRGCFEERHTSGKIDIFVEAYDLDDVNLDEIKYLTEKLPKLNEQVDPKFVGKWEFIGEMIESTKYFNPRRKYYKTETNLDVIELKDDGTTNIEFITWKEDCLLMNFNNIIKLGHISHIKRNYIKISIYLDGSTNSRPYNYIYKRIN